MARLWMSGAEWNTLTEFSAADSQLAVQSSVKRSGTYAVALTGAGGNTNYGFTQVLPASTTEGFIKSCLRRDNYTLGNSDIIQWSSSTNRLGYVRVNASAQLLIYTNETLRATSTFTLSVNTWYVIEVRAKCDVSGIIDVRVDGLSKVSYSGDTRGPSSETSWDRVRFALYRHATTASNSYIDDFAVNDTTGGLNDSWCGEGNVVLLMPNAAGTNTVWTVQGAASNYEAVDEIPPDGATTYNYSNTVDQKDTYNVAASPAGIGAILAVQLDSWLLKTTGATPGNVRQMIITGATEYFGSNIAPGTSFAIYSKVWDQNPNTVASWVSSDIDAIEIGAQSRT